MHESKNLKENLTPQQNFIHLVLIFIIVLSVRQGR